MTRVREIKEDVSGEATHTVSAYPAAVDQPEDHGDELLHGPYSCTPAGCYVSHCRPGTRTVHRCHTNTVLGWPARNVLLLLLLLLRLRLLRLRLRLLLKRCGRERGESEEKG